MIDRDEWIRRAEGWYASNARKVYEEAAARLKADAAAREELARRLREQGHRDATAGNSLRTAFDAMKSADPAKQAGTPAEKAEFYGRQLAILGSMAAATGHPKASTVARLDEGWKRVGIQQEPGKLGNPVAEKVVAEARRRFGDMTDEEALGQAIRFAKTGHDKATDATKKAMEKVDAAQVGFGGIDSLKTLKAHNEAHDAYMVQMARKNAFERLNNLLCESYSRVTGEDMREKMVTVGDLSQAERRKAKFDAGGANLNRAWREHVKGNRGIPDHDGFARTMLAGGVDDGKLMKFLVQKVGDGVGRDMVPDIVASAKQDVERKATEDATRRMKQANSFALTLSATGLTPAELRPKVAEPKVSPVSQPSVGGPADAVRKPKPAEQAKPKQAQPVVKPQEDGFSFMRRIKEMRDSILVKVGLKEAKPAITVRAAEPASEKPAVTQPAGRPRNSVPTAEDLKLMKAKERIDAAFRKDGSRKSLDHPEAPGFKKDREPPKPKHEMPPPSLGGFRR